MKKMLKKFLLIMLVVLLFVGMTFGCGQTQKSPDIDQGNGKISQPTEKTIITLYFSDKEAINLVPEKREIVKGTKSIEQIIVEELIKGPLDVSQLRTVPAEAKLLAIKIEDELAIVDFSEEFVNKHWGGSTGEIFTIYSIVNSLTELPKIKSVQFLVNGKKVGTLSGHLDLEKPIGRDERLIKK